MRVVYVGDLTILVSSLFQSVPLTRSRLPLDLFLLTTIALPTTCQCFLAALQGCSTLVQECPPMLNRFVCVLLDVGNVETKLASMVSCAPL